MFAGPSVIHPARPLPDPARRDFIEAVLRETAPEAAVGVE